MDRFAIFRAVLHVGKGDFIMSVVSGYTFLNELFETTNAYLTNACHNYTWPRAGVRCQSFLLILSLMKANQFVFIAARNGNWGIIYY